MTDMDISGALGPTGTVAPLELGPTGSVELGPTASVELGPTGITLDSLSGGTAEPPRILLSDILSQLSILQQQESGDRATLIAAGTPNLADIRVRLTSWVASGMQGACDLVRIGMTPPNVCSDGVSRNVFDYIVFLSGKTVADHLKAYQAILPEFEVGYRCSRTELVFCVIRVTA